MIVVYITKQLPNITQNELNPFISRFFFDILIGSVFNHPFYDNLISPYQINDTINSNITLIWIVFLRIVTGEMFIQKDNPSKIFNRYIFVKHQEIIKLFEQITEIEIPCYQKQEKSSKMDVLSIQ